jgi:hypothetical protein
MDTHAVGLQLTDLPQVSSQVTHIEDIVGSFYVEAVASEEERKKKRDEEERDKTFQVGDDWLISPSLW